MENQCFNPMGIIGRASKGMKSEGRKSFVGVKWLKPGYIRAGVTMAEWILVSIVFDD